MNTPLGSSARLLFGSLCACIEFQNSALAQIVALSIELQPASLSVSRGDIVEFSGTLHNIGETDLYINSSAFSLFGEWTELTVDDLSIYTAVPYPLLQGQLWSGVLFTVEASADALEGTYFGNLEIYGGVDASGSASLNSGLEFSVDVQAVPEPSSTGLVIGFSLLVYGIIRFQTAQRLDVSVSL